MGVDMDPDAPASMNSLRRSLAKVRSAAALLDIRGNDARVALPGSRSIPSLGPLPQPMEESRPRRKAILRKPVSKHAKMFLKKESALDTAMAELAKLAGASALPENASGAGAATRAVLEEARLEELQREPAAKEGADGPETEAAAAARLTPAERRHALHDQLAARVAALAKKLEVVNALQARVDASADPRLKDRARVHQNATQGLELMQELAKQERRAACERAIRFRDARSRTKDLPHFIQILKDESTGLSGLQQDKLKDADELIKKYARGWERKPAAVPPPKSASDRASLLALDALGAPAFAHSAPSPLGSRYHTHIHA